MKKKKKDSLLKGLDILAAGTPSEEFVPPFDENTSTDENIAKNTTPSEEFHADTYEEAERTRDELLQDPIYENVTIGDEPEERDFY